MEKIITLKKEEEEKEMIEQSIHIRTGGEKQSKTGVSTKRHRNILLWGQIESEEDKRAYREQRKKN